MSFFHFSRNFVFNILKYRNSPSQMFFKIGVLKHFAIFKGKQMCWSLFFNKVAGLRPAVLLKNRLQRRCFLANIDKFLRTGFYIEQLQWLLLKVGNSLYICVLCCFQSLLTLSCLVVTKRSHNLNKPADFSRRFV